MACSFLGLGSNLQQPLQQVNKAILLIKKIPQSEILKCSSFYETQALLPPERPYEFQDNYVNAVIKIKTTLNPFELLEQTQAIENSMGRKRSGQRWQARIIDIDILLYDDLVINTENLVVPHPEMHKRDFVLDPLKEIEPNLTISARKD